MEPHVAVGTSPGSAVGADVGAELDDEVGTEVEREVDGAVDTRVDAVFRASQDSPQLTPVEAYLLEALERLDAAESRAVHLQAALAHSRDIGAAVGVLMALRRLTRDQAFGLLRQASMAQNVKLHVLAIRVVETGSTDPS